MYKNFKNIVTCMVLGCLLFAVQGWAAVTNGNDLGEKKIDASEIRALYSLSHTDLTAKLDLMKDLDAWKRALALGGIDMSQNKITSAEWYFNLALKYVQGSTYAEERVTTLFPLAIVRFARGDQEKGLDYLLQAKKIVDSGTIRDEATKIALSIELGEAYYRLGMYEDSRSVYEEANGYMKKMDNELLVAKCKMGLGYAYTKLGRNLDKARELMLASCDVYKKNNMSADAAEALKCLGNLELGNNSDKARELYLKALVLYKDCDDDHGQGNCNFNLGIVCKDEGKYADALKYLNDAIYFYSRSGSPTGNGIAQLVMGQTYILMKKFPEAKAALDQATALLERSQSWDRLGETEESFGELYAAQGDNSKANDYYRKAMERYKRLNLNDRVDNLSRKLGIDKHGKNED